VNLSDETSHHANHHQEEQTPLRPMTTHPQERGSSSAKEGWSQQQHCEKASVESRREWSRQKARGQWESTCQYSQCLTNMSHRAPLSLIGGCQFGDQGEHPGDQRREHQHRRVDSKGELVKVRADSRRKGKRWKQRG
jgi:hypothetical protein